MVTRARQHVASGRRTPASSTEHRRLLDAFVAATENGDFASLERFPPRPRSQRTSVRRAETSQHVATSGQWLVEAATADSTSPAAAGGMEGSAMKITAALALSLSLAGGTLAAQDGVRSLLSKDLAGVPDKELLMITVEYPPGGSSPAHTHDAQAMVYVLEGSIVMQVKGKAPVTLTAGQTFYEGPDDVHLVSRNASQTAPARYLVFQAKKKGRRF